MKSGIIAMIVATFAAGSAVASGKVTDVDYLRANRCMGLASSIDGVVDAAALNNFIKAERGARPGYILDRGDAEFQRARKEARSSDRRERLTAELNTSCQAYLGGPANVTKQ